MVVIDLPADVFLDCGNVTHCKLVFRPSPISSELSFGHSAGKNSLVSSITAIIEERGKSRDMQVSHNYDDNIKLLIEVKHQLEMEQYPGKLTKILDLSSAMAVIYLFTLNVLKYTKIIQLVL